MRGTKFLYGLSGGVGAWNYPLQTCSWKVGPALACGNTFVYKPSPLTPLAATVLGEVLQVHHHHILYSGYSHLAHLTVFLLGKIL